MKLSSRSKHGLRAMVELALNYGQGLMQIKTIAERTGISSKYIEQLLSALKISGLLRSKIGLNGGYILARQPSKIKISEVINALEGPTYDTDCKQHDRFTKGCAGCVTAKVWAKLHKKASDYLDSTTLQDLIDMKN